MVDAFPSKEQLLEPDKDTVLQLFSVKPVPVPASVAIDPNFKEPCSISDRCADNIGNISPVMSGLSLDDGQASQTSHLVSLRFSI